MKRRNKKLEYICIGILAGAAFIVVMTLIVLTVTPAKRSYKGKTYDLKCLTKLEKNPLVECKERETLNKEGYYVYSK